MEKVNTSPDGWESFVKADETPDSYFCVVCLSVWKSKEGNRGYNRCKCGCIYSAESLIHLGTDARYVKVIVSGIAVKVPVAHLTAANNQPTPTFWRFWQEVVNRALLKEQGYGVTDNGAFERFS